MTTENSTSAKYYTDDSFKLSRFLRTLKKRWVAIVAVSAAVFGGTTYFTLTRIPMYQSTASLLISSSAIAISDVDSNAGSGSNLRQINLNTEISVLRSRPLIETALDKMREQTGKAIDPNFVFTIQGGLDIRPERDASVVRLSYNDSDPQRAKDVIKALMETYVDYSLKDRRTKSSNAITFIEKKLPDAKKQLDKAAQNVAQFRKSYNIIDPDSYAASVYKMRESLEQQAQDLQIKSAQTQRQLQALQQQVGQSPDSALSTAILGQDQVYQSLVKQYQDLETAYFLEKTRFQENHPTVQALRDRRDELARLLQGRAGAVLGGRSVGANSVAASGASVIQQTLATQLFETQTSLAVQETQLASIRAAQSELTTAFTQIPQLQQRYTELQRQLSLDTATYNKLSEKLEELRIAEAQEISSWRVLESPLVPSAPFSPNISRNLSTGAIIGLALGVLLALLLERLDQRIREVEEVRDLSDLPLLGAVPRTDLPSLKAAQGRSMSLPSSSQFYAFKEAISSLGLNLRYLGSDQSVRVLAFTSAVPAEGKSTITFNLAILLAELGHSVLLVDADMRKPTLHRLAGTSNSYGLSTAIATMRPWQELIRPLDEADKLHFLAAGPSAPNPIVLLESQKMDDLLKQWRTAYDYVLIDTPPVVGIADAQCLASKVDSIILVAAIERSTRSAIVRSLDVLQNARGKVAGLLINMINQGDSSYYYSYYTSYYYNERTPLAAAKYAGDTTGNTTRPTGSLTGDVTGKRTGKNNNTGGE
ncbi:MAG: polysaccharide biosynthesis tyrosine autokinase [Pseudanabaena sp. ELA607]